MAVRPELKKVLSRVKTAQSKLQTLLKNQDWVEEARKYAEAQGKEVKKLLRADVGKVRTFLEREKKTLEKFQKELPGEVKKFREFLLAQSKELQKLLANVSKMNGKRKTKTRKAKASGTKKKKKASSESTTNA
jgi:hypothetical protein